MGLFDVFKRKKPDTEKIVESVTKLSNAIYKLSAELNEEINNRMEIIQDIILYYMSDTQTLVEVFKKIDKSHSKGKFSSRVLTRVIASRNSDNVAIKFCQEYKSQLT